MSVFTIAAGVVLGGIVLFALLIVVLALAENA